MRSSRFALPRDFSLSTVWTSPPPPPSVFDAPKPESIPPRTSKSTVSGSERFVGEEPDYNTEQRAQWLATCARFKEADLQAYRDCYAKEKRKSRERLQRGVADRERGQRGSYRNSGESSVPGEPQKNPAFDVEVESVKD